MAQQSDDSIEEARGEFRYGERVGVWSHCRSSTSPLAPLLCSLGGRHHTPVISPCGQCVVGRSMGSVRIVSASCAGCADQDFGGMGDGIMMDDSM